MKIQIVKTTPEGIAVAVAEPLQFKGVTGEALSEMEPCAVDLKVGDVMDFLGAFAQVAWDNDWRPLGYKTEGCGDALAGGKQSAEAAE